MRISIVTISYNQSRYLRRCIDSVLNQDVYDVEYIVVDPGSTDRSRDLIAEYSDRIVSVLEPDAGPADGLNRGFAVATGDVFGFINADDYLLPGALAAVNEHFETFGLEQFASGSGYIDRFGTRVRVCPTRMTKMRCIYGACTMFQQGTFFPGWMFRKVGGFNIDNGTCWDGELFARFLFSEYRHALIDGDLAVFSVHKESISGSGRLTSQYRVDRERIFREQMGRSSTFLDRGVSIVFRGTKIIGSAISSITMSGSR